MATTKQGEKISPIIMDAFSFHRGWREEPVTSRKMLSVVVGPKRFHSDLREAIEIQCIEPDRCFELDSMLLLRDPVLTEAAKQKLLSFAWLALEIELMAPFRYEIAIGARDDDAAVRTVGDLFGDCYRDNLQAAIRLWNELVSERQLMEFDDGAFPVAMDPAETAEWLSRPDRVGLITDSKGGLADVSRRQSQVILDSARSDGRAILGGEGTIRALLGEAFEDYFDTKQLRLAALEHSSGTF